MCSTLGLTLLLAFVQVNRSDEPRPTDPARFLRIADLRAQLAKGTKRDERVAALRQLMIVRPPAVEAVPDLVAALADADEFVRAYAALALLFVDQRRSKDALAVLTPLFGDKTHPPAVLRDTTLFLELAQLQPAHPDLVAALLTLMRGDHPLGQFAAYRALQHLDPGARDAAPLLRAALTDAQPRIRLVAAEGLARVAPADKAQAAATLEALLTVKEKPIRGDAAIALVRLDPGSANKGVRVLRSLFQEPGFKPGRTLARQLLDLDPGQADIVVPVLAEGLADGDRKVRLAALSDLAACGRLAAAQESVLRRCLVDPDPDVARTAAEVLLLARPQLARDFLPDILGRDKDFGLFRLLDQLDQLTAQEDEDLAVQKIARRAEEKDRSKNERLQAVTRLHALARLAVSGPAARGAVVPLTRLLTDLSDPDHRQSELLGELLAAQTIYALGRVGPRAAPAVPVLLKLARSPSNSPALRVEAAAALKQIDPDAATQADIP